MLKINQILTEKISTDHKIIAQWFEHKFAEFPAVFYNSIDLRHSGFKIAPIDTNCFPAGFNNLSLASKKKSIAVALEFLNQNFAAANNILIIPENHTRNLRYFKNILILKEILEACGRKVIIGSMIPELTAITKIDLEDGSNVDLHPLIKKQDKIITIDGFCPDLMISNNDFTDGPPDILTNITQPIIPRVEIGWYQRTKSNHFDIYNQLAKELCDLIKLDHWLISSIHSHFKNLDFKQRLGISDLADEVEIILAKIAKKYQEYNISDQPYCYIKSNSGTYGMAIMSVFSKQAVLEINKKERNKMNVQKNSVQNTNVIIQEGIRTVDLIHNQIAEPMIYMINGQVTGNLFRINNSRNNAINLNANGASFADLENLNDDQINLGLGKNNIQKIYSLIARLAALAAAIENKFSKISDTISKF
jgi:glutamate--cysteine ligase